MPNPVRRFHHQDLVRLNLQRNGNGWMLKGRFRIEVEFEPCDDVGRYEYRQYIRGEAWTQRGMFTTRQPSETSWIPVGTRQNHAGNFAMPGGLSTSWREDAQTQNGVTLSFGHRRTRAVSVQGLVDRYSPDQRTGNRYHLMDTYGLEGTRRVNGTKIYLRLHYRSLIVDKQGGGWRRVLVRNFNYEAERIMTT